MLSASTSQPPGLGALGLSLLEPPYQACRPAGRTPPALGGVVTCDLRVGRTVCERFLDYLRLAPWCAPCAVVPACVLTCDLLSVLDRLPLRCAKAIAAPGLTPVEPGAVIAEVSARPAPSPGRMAQYVARRLAHPGLAEALIPCFDPRPDAARDSRSSRSRRLQLLSPLTARDWTAVGRLARLERSQSCSAERLAHTHALDPRTVRAWVARYLGLSWEEMRGLAGWESVLEAVLRHCGYLRADEDWQACAQ